MTLVGDFNDFLSIDGTSTQKINMYKEDMNNMYKEDMNIYQPCLIYR